MLQRLSRSVLCLLICLLAYWTYAQTIVPLIEPGPRKSGSPERGKGAGQTPVIDRWKPLFSSDAWEISGKAKRLETDHGSLLFLEYQPRPNGTIELKPVTLVCYPSESPSDGELPILIQAPRGAVLQFDRPVDVMRGEFGNPVGARLLGQIVIRRPRSAADEDDEIFVTTRNVKIDRHKIWTPNDVEFRFGPHWGRGRDLQIQLDSADSEPSERAPGGAGVRLLELMHIEKILIAADDRGLREAVRSPDSVYAPAAPATEPSMPIEVRCAGPFRFDFLQSVASLSEQVRLTRRYPSGLLDSLDCDQLDIYFHGRGSAPQPGPAVTAAASALPDQQISAMQVERFVAQGQPVVFEAPSQEARARASLVECWYAERRIVLEDPSNAWLKHRESEMSAPRIDYAADPEQLRELGKLEAQGPGEIRGKTGDAQPRSFTATWNDVLRLQPHEGRHVLSLQGGARVEFEGSGAFSGDQMHLFLREQPQAAAGASTPAGERMTPDSLVVLGDIRIDSPRLTGTARRELKVWFVPLSARQQPGPAGAASASASTTPRGPLQPISSPPSGSPGAEAWTTSGETKSAGPPLHFEGDVVEARVVMAEQMRLNDLTVAGSVRIHRDPDQQGARSVKIGGDLLEISDISTGQGRVTVRGAPAEGGAEGLLLRGAEILCHQQSNMMWIPGPGEMLTPPRPRVEGGTPVPPLRVTWGGSMQFDGRTIAFREGVEAHGEHQAKNGDISRFLIRGSDLFVDLNRRIDFVQPGNLDEEQVDLAGLRFPGEVWLENRTHAAAGPWKSWEEMQVTDLQIDHATGRLEAQGPGWLSSVRLNAGSSSPAPLPAAPAADSKLIHIQVHFQRSLVGNLQRREVEFFDRVRTIYGPVADWQQRIDVHAESLGAGGIELTSDRLLLAEIPSPSSPQSVHHEIRAMGNVQVRGEQFRAQGHELSYDDGKDLLILKSDGRGYATVTQEGGPGATEARTFYIWPKSKLIKTDRVRSVEFGPVGR